MSNRLTRWLLIAVTGCLSIMLPAAAAEAPAGPLVDVQWLERQLGRDDMLLLDASPAPLHAAGHIAGAVPVDIFSFGALDFPRAEMERRLQSWGVSEGKTIVVYDQGGTYLATRLFFDLLHQGYPAQRLHLLDGGLAKWREGGRQVTKDATPPPRPGSFRITRVNDDVRVRLPEFLNASGDPARHALVEALEPSYHFGETRFFDRAGHVPHAIMWPTADLFNADKTFKSVEELRRMALYLGIRPEQQVHTYCGGGVAATVPFFALKFLLGYPQVSVYKESQLEWLRDERQLPFWTYDAPYLQRDMHWLNAWGGRMLRMFSMVRLSVLDVRPLQAYQLGHVPYSVSVPAEQFRAGLADPAPLAALLGQAGVDPSHEAVIVSDGGLNARSALAFVMLEKLGQQRVSILSDSVDEWGLRGMPLTKEPTVVGRPRSPQELAIAPATFTAAPRPGVLIADASAASGPYPKVFLASGQALPARAPAGRVIHVPHRELVNADGSVKAAKEVWKILDKAGLPRYAEIVCIADDPGEAAINYVVLRLMGFPDVKVLAL